MFLADHRTTDNLKSKKAFTMSFADRANLVASDYFANCCCPDSDFLGTFFRLLGTFYRFPCTFRSFPCTFHRLLRLHSGLSLRHSLNPAVGSTRPRSRGHTAAGVARATPY